MLTVAKDLYSYQSESCEIANSPTAFEIYTRFRISVFFLLLLLLLVLFTIRLNKLNFNFRNIDLFCIFDLILSYMSSKKIFN